MSWWTVQDSTGISTWKTQQMKRKAINNSKENKKLGRKEK